MASLKHNVALQNFSLHLSQTYRCLFEDKKFSDVTLISDDQTQFQSHRFILSASSKVFANILENIPQSNPVVFLRGVSSEDLESLLKYLYYGEVNIPYNSVQQFLNTLDSFDIVQNVQSNLGWKGSKILKFAEEPDDDLKSEELKESKKFKFPGEEEFDFDIKSEVITSKKQVSEETKHYKDKKEKDIKKSVKKHALNLKCSFCDYVASRNTSLKNHINVIHLNIRNLLPCEVCGKVFTTHPSYLQGDQMKWMKNDQPQKKAHKNHKEKKLCVKKWSYCPLCTLIRVTRKQPQKMPNVLVTLPNLYLAMTGSM